MQTGEATVENSMEFPQKTKNGTAFWPSNFLPILNTLINIPAAQSLYKIFITQSMYAFSAFKMYTAVPSGKIVPI